MPAPSRRNDPADKISPQGIFKPNWVTGAMGGRGVEIRAGKTRVVYAGAERALGGGGRGRDLAGLHDAVKEALARVRGLGWSAEALAVGFAERGSRYAYAWRPGANPKGMRILCLQVRVARAATREWLVFILAHELAHHWREELRAAAGAGGARVRYHDKVFCDGLRAAAGDLAPVTGRCARSAIRYDDALDSPRDRAPPGELRVTVSEHGWAARWVPHSKGRPPVEVRDARSLAAVAARLTPEQLEASPVTYQGSARGDFPRPSTLLGFMKSVAAMARAARARRAAR